MDKNIINEIIICKLSPKVPNISAKIKLHLYYQSSVKALLSVPANQL
jgi:hypothetical protein